MWVVELFWSFLLAFFSPSSSGMDDTWHCTVFGGSSQLTSSRSLLSRVSCSSRQNLRPGDVNCQRLLSMYGSFEQRRLRQQQQQQQTLRRNRNGPVERYLEQYSTEYEKALRDLSHHFRNRRSLSTSSSVIAGGWRRLDTNPDPRGGTFERRLSEDLIVEVHVLFPVDRQPLN